MNDISRAFIPPCTHEARLLSDLSGGRPPRNPRKLTLIIAEGYCLCQYTLHKWSLSRASFEIASLYITYVRAGNLFSNHIASKGYQVIAKELEPTSYVLDKDKLKGMPYNMYWSVQEVNPEHYLGKDIATIGYKVKNHPLEEIYNTSSTLVYVMLSASKPKGGYSLPNIEGSAGWVYSLDGRTLEEISRMTYAE